MEPAAQHKTDVSVLFTNQMQTSALCQADMLDLAKSGGDPLAPQRVFQGGKRFGVIAAAAEDHAVRIEAESGETRRKRRVMAHGPQDRAIARPAEQGGGETGCGDARLGIPTPAFDLMDTAARQSFGQEDGAIPRSLKGKPRRRAARLADAMGSNAPDPGAKLRNLKISAQSHGRTVHEFLFCSLCGKSQAMIANHPVHP